VDRIVAAFIELGRHHSVELVLKLPAEASVKYADIVGIRVIAEHLGEKELANLYGSALGFVFPSLYEGFGLPILEAMSSGCPVITSSVSACPEVAGEAALLVNPRRTDELIRAMTVLVESPSERDRLVSAGLDRVRQFTWEHSAALHAQAFLEACGGQG
jgi:glycosyltransferase involved in cell wall biosynthesis